MQAPAKTSVAATITPGSDSGTTTDQKVRMGPAPRLRAASSRVGSTWAIAE